MHICSLWLLLLHSVTGKCCTLSYNNFLGNEPKVGKEASSLKIPTLFSLDNSKECQDWRNSREK